MYIAFVIVDASQYCCGKARLASELVKGRPGASDLLPSSNAGAVIGRTGP